MYFLLEETARAIAADRPSIHQNSIHYCGTLTCHECTRHIVVAAVLEEAATATISSW